MTNVTPLRARGASLNDVVGMMRQTADMIEAGEIVAQSALLIVPVADDWPAIYGWGEDIGDLGRIATLDLAKAWFIANMTAREP